MKVPNYTISFTPHWENGCCHETNEYLFTVTYTLEGTRVRDVYVWGDEPNRTRLCVRYGDEASYYMSLPDLSEFLYLMLGNSEDRDDETWAVVADAILNHCTLTAKLSRKTIKKMHSLVGAPFYRDKYQPENK